MAGRLRRLRHVVAPGLAVAVPVAPWLAAVVSAPEALALAAVGLLFLAAWNLS